MVNFKHNYINDILSLTLEGDMLGDESGIKLAEFANEQITLNYLKCITDLSSVRYMNSTGIGVLITLLTKFRNKGGELVLLNPSDQIKKMLIITKLNSIFTVFETEEKAVEFLSKQQ